MFNNNQLSNLLPKFLTAVLILAVFFGSIANPTEVHALGTTITVNTSLDTIAADGKCTLREAIINANADAQTHADCLAGSGNDTIDFANSLGVATIILGSTLPNISDADGLTIGGNGFITISGNNLYRVFFVNAGIPFTLDSLIISNAKATSSSGSVIYSSYGGPITISNSRLQNNTEGAISVFYTSLTVMNSNFSGNSGMYGGGIYSSGILTVSNSIFSGNSSSSGSGGSAVYVAGTASITNSVFTINIQPGGRGSVFNDGTTTITNSTFYQNISSLANEVGAVYNQGALTITNSTFSGNSTSGSGGSGDIYQLGATATLKLYNNILANSTGGGNCNFSGGGTVSGNNNLIEDAATACGFTNGVNGNIIGSDPALGVLADNGGPTHTFALSSNSPALGAGTNTGCPSTDQRGVARPQNGTCDMGAFESNAQPGPALIVNANNDLTDGFCDVYLAGVTDCTLREAIDYANSVSGTNTITFAANYTITLGSQLPVVTDTTIINGKGAANTLIQASTCNPVTLPGGCTPATYRVFQVTSGGNLTLDRLTVSNGQCAGACATLTAAGGGAYNAGTLTVTNSTFSGNFSSYYGGGINSEGTLTITNSTFSGNSAVGTSGGGGGVYSNGSTLAITNSTFSGNSSNKYGGGVLNDVGTLTMSNSTFSANSSRYGGGVNNSNGAILNITNSTFSSNTATSLGGGGGAYNYGTLTVTGSTFSGNFSDVEAAGAANYGTMTVTKSTFSSNTTSSTGGGLANGGNGSTLTVTNSTISGNNAVYGGGIANSGYLTVTNSTISGNTATAAGNVGGGGIANSGVLKIKNTIIANSIAGGDCWSDNLANPGVVTPTNNLIELLTGLNVCFLANNSTGDIVGSDPNLGLLTGSPAYYPLLAGSPAINAGNDANCATAPVSNTSQNGVTRPQGSHCDIGSYEVPSESLSSPSKWSSSFDLSHGWTVADYVRTVGDVNNDGRDDLIGFGSDGVYVALSNGTGFGAISKWSSSFDLSHGWTVADYVRTVGDVNNDGRDDLIGFGLDGVYVALSNGTGFGAISKWSSSFDLSHGWTVADYVRTVGDVNNDGRDDLIGFGSDGVYVALSNGASFDAIGKWSSSFDLSHGWTVASYVRTAGDVNNDGRDDLIGFGSDGVYVALSNGASFDAINKWSSSFDLSHGWTVASYVRTAGDMNNDGKADLVGFGLDGVYVAIAQ